MRAASTAGLLLCPHSPYVALHTIQRPHITRTRRIVPYSLPPNSYSVGTILPINDVKHNRTMGATPEVTALHSTPPPPVHKQLSCYQRHEKRSSQKHSRSSFPSHAWPHHTHGIRVDTYRYVSTHHTRSTQRATSNKYPDANTYQICDDQLAPPSLPVSLFLEMSRVCRYRRFPMEAVIVPGKRYGVEAKAWARLQIGSHTPCMMLGRETLRR